MSENLGALRDWACQFVSDLIGNGKDRIDFLCVKGMSTRNDVLIRNSFLNPDQSTNSEEPWI